MAIVLSLAGCTTEAAPGFVGPWAEQIAAEYEATDSEFVREVLRDGIISDQENSEATSRYIGCMKDAGITVKEIAPNGSIDYSFTGADGAEIAVESEKTCSMESGYYPIGSLYTWISANPENLDVAEIVAACLVRSKVVTPGYTADDYRSEAPNGEFSFGDEHAGRAALTECSTAPLTAFTQ